MGWYNVIFYVYRRCGYSAHQYALYIGVIVLLSLFQKVSAFALGIKLNYVRSNPKICTRKHKETK